MGHFNARILYLMLSVDNAELVLPKTTIKECMYYELVDTFVKCLGKEWESARMLILKDQETLFSLGAVSFDDDFDDNDAINETMRIVGLED